MFWGLIHSRSLEYRKVERKNSHCPPVEFSRGRTMIAGFMYRRNMMRPGLLVS